MKQCTKYLNLDSFSGFLSLSYEYLRIRTNMKYYPKHPKIDPMQKMTSTRTNNKHLIKILHSIFYKNGTSEFTDADADPNTDDKGEAG